MIDTLTNSVETLYALYHKDIVSFFADHLADRETSWDLCHEVFLRLLLTLASGTNLKHPHRVMAGAQAPPKGVPPAAFQRPASRRRRDF